MKKAPATTKGVPLKDAPSVIKQKSVKAHRGGFVYQIQYCPNPDVVIIHARTSFPSSDATYLNLRWQKKNEKALVKEGGKKMHLFYKELAKIRGLGTASPTDGYSLQCGKVNGLFSWTEILPKILAVIQVHIAKKRKMVPTESVRRLSGGGTGDGW